VQTALADVERRQVEQLQRVVSRAASRYSEAASEQFDTSIRAAREADGVLAERVTQVTDAAVQRVERRLSQFRSAIDRQRDEALEALEQRAQEVESTLRERLREIEADAESERSIIEARLSDLARRLDELTTRA